MIDGGVVDHGIGIEVTEEADPGTGREEGGKPWEFFCHVIIFFAPISVTFHSQNRITAH